MSNDFARAFTWGCGVTLGVLCLLAFLIVGLPLLMAGGCLAGLAGIGAKEAAERGAVQVEAPQPERVTERQPVREAEPVPPRIVRDSETESAYGTRVPAEAPEAKPTFLIYDGMLLSAVEEELGAGRRTRKLGDAATYVWDTAGGTLDATFENDELVDWSVGGIPRGSIPSAEPRPVSGPQERAGQEKPVENTGDGKCSLAEFNRIEYGMSYAKVVQIIGGKGELTSGNRIEGVPGVMDSIQSEMYQWKGTAFASSAIVMFQNDKVIQKSQFNLK